MERTPRNIHTSRKNSWMATLIASLASVLIIFTCASINSSFPLFSRSMLEEYREWSFIQIPLVCGLLTNLYGYYILAYGMGRARAIDGHGWPLVTILGLIVFTMIPISSIKHESLGLMLMLIVAPYYFALKYIYADIHGAYGVVD